MQAFIHLSSHALIISSFVFVMMLLIEVIHVSTAGKWQSAMMGRPGRQYLLAALLGAFPGCLGAFSAVTLYTHRMFSLGAVVTTMIATSGDEAFVLFTLVPKKALLLTGILVGLGILAGWLTDQFPIFASLLPFRSQQKRASLACKGPVSSPAAEQRLRAPATSHTSSPGTGYFYGRTAGPHS